MRVRQVAHIGVAALLMSLLTFTTVLAAPQQQKPDLPQVRDLPLDSLKEGLRPYVALLAALGSIYFFIMTWRHGLTLANSGDDPEIRAKAMEAFLVHLLGGVLFFGASLFAGVLRYFIYN